MKHRYKILTTTLAVVACFLIVAGAANAETGLTIQPIKVNHTVEAGGSITDTIKLINAGSQSVNVLASVEDFVPSAGNSSIKFVGRAEGVTTVRDWITFNVPDNFGLGGNETRFVSYTITAPRNAEPGSHFGIMFFKATKPDDTSQLKVGTRVGSLVFVTVPGDFVKSGELANFSAPFLAQGGNIEFKIRLRNTGTVHFEPEGEVVVTSIFGKEKVRVPIAGQVVLPAGERDMNATWQTSRFLIGIYKASANIQDGEGNVITTDTERIIVFPFAGVPLGTKKAPALD